MMATPPSPFRRAASDSPARPRRDGRRRALGTVGAVSDHGLGAPASREDRDAIRVGSIGGVDVPELVAAGNGNRGGNGKGHQDD